MTATPSPDELGFYYHGFHRALRRFRSATILGWIITAAGAAGIPLGWRTGAPLGLLDIALCGAALIGGLALVSEAVSFLNAYVTISFPAPGTRGDEPPDDDFVAQVRLLMHDVEAGGWQEAYAAIRALEQLGAQRGLPPPQ